MRIEQVFHFAVVERWQEARGQAEPPEHANELTSLVVADLGTIKDKRVPEFNISSAQRATAQAIVVNLDASLTLDYAQLAAELRAAGINTEVYGGADKLGKQFKYADGGGVPLALLCGSREHAAGVVKVKNLRVTDPNAVNEREVPRGDVVAAVRALLASL